MKRLLLCLMLASPVMASDYTIDEGGINSAVLNLDGTGVHIGQMEPLGRSGSFGYDNLPANYNTQIRPFRVYIGIGVDGRDSNRIDAHATRVAGVMISDGSLFGVHEGVAPGASLHSAGASVGLDQYADTALAMDGLARKDEIRAINLSWLAELQGGEQILDNAYLTEYVDWASRIYDEVLFVAAHPYTSEDPGTQSPSPADNYNGITVASSESYPPMNPDNTYAKVWSQNFYGDVPFLRSMTDILAPGEGIHLAELNNGGEVRDGSSYAAPHVTGTVALLQELGENKRNMGDPRFQSLYYQKHQVMKAVIMNGADKLDGVLGSQRDVLKRNNDKWTDTIAGLNPAHSLDPELGVGHLNAKNSADNLEPGEYDPGVLLQPSTHVPTTAWNFDESGGVGIRKEYYFNQPISGWFAATLTWDRYIECTSGDEYEYGAQFFNASLTNLDLYLMPPESNDLNDAIYKSIDQDENVEHIFDEVLEGMYKLVVVNNGGLEESVEYGLAWRSSPLSAAQPGDYDSDNDVDGRDFLEWQRGNSPNPLSSSDLSDWQANYGTGSLAASTAVPEPSCLALLFGLVPLMKIRGT